MAKVVVCGSMNADLIYRVHSLPAPGETVLCTHGDRAPGGKGSNQAIQAARMGADTVMLGCLGQDDHGRMMLNALQQSGVDTRYIRLEQHLPTGTALICVDDAAQNTIVVHSGANAAWDEALLREADACFAPGNVLLVQLEIPIPMALAAMRLARARGMKVILDPTPCQKIPAEMIALCDIIKPNEVEAAYHSGISQGADNMAFAAQAAQALRQKGAAAILITLGKDGWYYDEGQTTLQGKAFSVQAVDTTAAGDSFSGALAYAVAEGLPMAEALRLACGAAALSVGRHGAVPSLPVYSEVEEFLKTQK